MGQDCTTAFIAGAIVGIVLWEIIQVVASAIFNNRSKILAFIVIALAVLGVVLAVRLLVDPCTQNCVAPPALAQSSAP